MAMTPAIWSVSLLRAHMHQAVVRAHDNNNDNMAAVHIMLHHRKWLRPMNTCMTVQQTRGRLLCWAALRCAALRCAGQGWAGLGWAGLGWAGLGWAGLGWAVMIHNSSNQMLLQMQSNLSNSMVAQSTY